MNNKDTEIVDAVCSNNGSLLLDVGDKELGSVQHAIHQRPQFLVSTILLTTFVMKIKPEKAHRLARVHRVPAPHFLLVCGADASFRSMQIYQTESRDLSVAGLQLAAVAIKRLVGQGRVRQPRLRHQLAPVAALLPANRHASPNLDKRSSAAASSG